MASLDNAFRKQTIPYLAQIFGYNRNEQSDQDVSQATNRGDLEFLGNPTTLISGYGGSSVPLKDNYIRILKPARAELVAAYLSISLRMSSNEPNPQFRISVTKTIGETDLGITALTDDEIWNTHRKLTGNDIPFSNSAGQLISVHKLDITDIIGKSGTVDFRSDCFVIGVHFLTVPVASIFHLYKFSIEGSALVVA